MTDEKKSVETSEEELHEEVLESEEGSETTETEETQEETKEEVKEEEFKIPHRKTGKDNKDEVIKRLQEKNKKLKEKGVSEEEASPDINDQIAQAVADATALSDDVDELIDNNPALKGLKSKIMKVARDPGHVSVSLKMIGYGLLGENGIKTGAALQKQQQKKTNETKVTGSRDIKEKTTPAEDPRDWDTATYREKRRELARKAR